MKKLLYLLFILSVFSCEKSKDPSSESPIVGTWKIVAYESRQNSSPTWSDAGEPCKLDDTEEYSANGNWVRYDGNYQCGGSTGVVRGRWALRASNTKVVYTYDDFAGEYESTVDELSASTLVLSWAAGDINGTQYRATYRKL
jgi:hypothetical protein